MNGNGSLDPGSPSLRGRSHRPRDFEYSSSPRVWDSSDSDDEPYHRPGHFGAHIGPSDDMDGTDTAKEVVGTKRRHHKKTSGGFLLGGSLSRSKRTHASGEGKVKSWQDRFRNGADADDNVSTTSPKSEKSQGKAPAYVEHLARGRRVTPPLPGGIMDLPTPSQSSLTPPPQSDRGSTTSQTSVPSTNSASIDPNQLIQMALSLSEGRRRAASGVYAPPTPKQDRRVASYGGVIQTVHPGSPLANDRVRHSMRRSVVPSQTPPRGPKPYAGPDAEDGSPEPSAVLFPDISDVTYEFSISSLQRAERAKKYFELSHNYRKLLQTLPPLPGNGTFTAQASILGRQYNPLQYLRNERLRQRKNMQLSPGPEDFDDVPTVTEYVKSVQQMAKRTSEGYTGTTLPPFQQFKGRKEPQGPARHSRYNTASSRILYFDCEWSISPTAMLADTIWTEDPQNKWALEDRVGQKLFPIYQPPSAPPGNDDEMRSRTSGGRSRATTLDSQPPPRKNSETRGRHKRKFLSIHKVDGEHTRRRAWHRGRSQSSSKGSSRSSNSSFGHLAGTTADGINIGPLARHMRNEMQQAEGDNASETRSPKWDELPNNESRPVTAPKALLTPELRPTTRKRTSDPLPLELRRSKSFTEGINDSMDSRLTDDEVPHSAIEPGHGSMGEIFGTSPVGMIGSITDNDTSLDLEKHDIQMVDFAAQQYNQQMQRESFESSDNDQSRKSFESARSTDMQRQKTENSIIGLLRSSTAESNASRGKSKTISQILKGSRLADLVRRGDGDVRKEAALRLTQRRLTNETSDGTDMEESAGLKRTATNPLESTTSLDQPRYHVPLPSFKFPNGIDNVEKRPEVPPAPIARQQSFRRERGLLSRSNSKNKVPRIEIPTDKKLKDVAKDQASPSVRSLLSPIRRFRSTNSARSLRGGGSPPQSAVVSTLSLAGTGLEATLDDSPRPKAKRRWSIADQLDRVASNTTDTVSMRDVERTRALFLSSGIKAAQLRRRTETPPEQRMALLIEAEKMTGQDAGLTVRRDEHRVAGKLWHDAITEYHRDSEKRVLHFHDKTIPEMRDRIEQLRHIVGERLTVRVQTTADEADAFAADISARQTLAVKAVHDAIDGILRNRRKKFRWLRRMGFSLLEYVVVTIMWIFWLVFTMVRMVRGTLRGCSKAVGWLIWV